MSHCHKNKCCAGAFQGKLLNRCCFISEKWRFRGSYHTLILSHGICHKNKCCSFPAYPRCCFISKKKMEVEPLRPYLNTCTRGQCGGRCSGFSPKVVWPLAKRYRDRVFLETVVVIALRPLRDMASTYS